MRRSLLATMLALLLCPPAARAQTPPQEAPPPEVPPEETPTPAPSPSSTPTVDLNARLEPGERDLLLSLAWRTLAGHLTNHPIRDSDLEGYAFTPRLMAKRGCFVTLKKGDKVRGRQGDIEPTRPLYQQVIVFTRRAATRDPRFLPLTDLELPDLAVEIEVIGERHRVGGPEAIQIDRHGIFLEKWGRRAVFLPGVAGSQGLNAERALDELCKQAALPPGAWAQGARIEVFTAETISGPRPPPQPAPLPAEPGASPSPASPGRS